MNITKIDVQFFIVLYVAHKVVEYLLQTEWQAVNKSTNWRALIIHSLIYSTTLCVAVYIFTTSFILTAISWIVLLITHIYLDRRNFTLWWCKHILKINKPEEKGWFLIELDQAFHYLVIFLLSLRVS